MFLAGVNLSNDALLELARLVNGDELADRLEETYGSGVHVLGLTNVERETILRRPAGLACGFASRSDPGARRPRTRWARLAPSRRPL